MRDFKEELKDKVDDYIRGDLRYHLLGSKRFIFLMFRYKGLLNEPT